MITNQKVYTVESVTSGHPDKICDQISDAILDACLAQDPNSRVAVESFGGHGLVVIGGEVTTLAKLNYEQIAKKVYKDIGYGQELTFLVNIVEQSPDIAMGVNPGGAGDQGIMYGYATDETPEFLPWAVVKVHALAKRLQNLRESGIIPWLKPDGKTQITMADGQVKTILVSTQHDAKVSQDEIKKTLIETLIKPIMGDIVGIETGAPFEKGARPSTNDVGALVLVNPTGRFVQGGFEADTGLTGRKIMVDTYCGLIPHGGGCFSGKDPSKVDRSAAYMARFAAKNMVANGYAKKCLVSVAYAIGKAEPLMVDAIDENGKSLSALVNEKFDFKPLAIIEKLELRQPMYQKTASYGHFGNADLPWEKVVKI